MFIPSHLALHNGIAAEIWRAAPCLAPAVQCCPVGSSCYHVLKEIETCSSLGMRCPRVDGMKGAGASSDL